MRNNFLKRLLYLWTFELFNAVVLLPLLLWSLKDSVNMSIATFYPAGLVSLILLVGTLFWYLKYRDIRNHTHRIQQHRHLFQRMKLLILILLLIFPVVVIIQLDNSPFPDLCLGNALGLLALLEYINYFYIQLMYDNQRDLQYLLRYGRLKRAAMVRELGI